jgi:hypothetical protein
MQRHQHRNAEQRQQDGAEQVRMGRIEGRQSDHRAEDIPERYLAASRAADIENGCAAAALASELHRAPMPVRGAFQKGAEASAEALSQVNAGEGWALYAMLVGALSIIRAVPDSHLHEEIRADIVRVFR